MTENYLHESQKPPATIEQIDAELVEIDEEITAIQETQKGRAEARAWLAKKYGSDGGTTPLDSGLDKRLTHMRRRQ